MPGVPEGALSLACVASRASTLQASDSVTSISDLRSLRRYFFSSKVSGLFRFAQLQFLISLWE